MQNPIAPLPGATAFLAFLALAARTRRLQAPEGMCSPEKRFVYLIRSETDGRPYTGVTSNVPQRLAVHNSGGSRSTAPHRPWRLVVSLEFSIERYLKTGSGRAFANRHFV